MAGTMNCVCGRTLLVEDDQRGQTAQCPICGKILNEDILLWRPSETAVQAELPPVRPPCADDAITEQVDVRKPHWGRGWLVASLLFGCVISVLGAGGAWFSWSTPHSRLSDIGPQSKALTQVCDAFKVKHLRYPDALAELLVRDEFGIIWLDEPFKLLDPFGKPYQYDKNGPRNQGLHPDIWHVAPDGTVIGNWPKVR